MKDLFKKNIIAVILNSSDIVRYQAKNKNYYDFLSLIQSDNIAAYVIDVSELFKFKKKTFYPYSENTKKNQFYFQPKNIIELYKFAKKINCVALFQMPNNLGSAPIQFYLKVLGFKRFAVATLGYLYDNSIDLSKNIKHNFLYFENYKLHYFLFRILHIFGFVKSVDYYFESSQKNLSKIDMGISNKIFKKFNFINLSYYKKKFRINSSIYYNFLTQKLTQSEKYIVLVDSGIDHEDVIIREGNLSTNKRKLFYKNLFVFLKNISELYGKEVIFCQHPKINYTIYPEFNEIKNAFKCIKFETEKHINDSEIVLFFESSAIVNAILLKKKIINLQSNLMGPYLFKRNNLYKNEINLYQVDLNDFSLPSKKELDFILKDRTKYYDRYIQDNIFFEKNISCYDQIKNILNENFFKN